MVHRRILLLIPTAGSYGRHVIDGILKYCTERGAKWSFFHEDSISDAGLLRARRLIRSRWPNGIIGYFRIPEFMRVIRRSGLPAVNTSGGLDCPDPLRVHADNLAIGRMAAEHFLERGFRNFGFCGMSSEYYSRQRQEGFTTTLAQAGFACAIYDGGHLAGGVLDWRRRLTSLEGWLRKLQKPAAILGSSDVRGPELMMACQGVGLRVPDDVAILGVDNDETMCKVCPTPLSSVDVASTRIGHEAAVAMDCLMRGRRVVGPVLVKPRGVVVRQSSDVVAVADKDVSDAIRFIRNNADRPIAVKDVLKAVPICRTKLEVQFRQLLGRTPAEEIRRVHMEQARKLLAETALNMPAVAKGAGFTSNSVFSVIFKQETGSTPTAYRGKYAVQGKAM